MTAMIDISESGAFLIHQTKNKSSRSEIFKSENSKMKFPNLKFPNLTHILGVGFFTDPNDFLIFEF